jgi:ribonuclease D
MASCLRMEITKAERVSTWLAPELMTAQLAYPPRTLPTPFRYSTNFAQRLHAADRADMYQACVNFLPTRVKLELKDWPNIFAY